MHFLMKFIFKSNFVEIFRLKNRLRCSKRFFQYENFGNSLNLNKTFKFANVEKEFSHL